MGGRDKTREELAREVGALRRRVAELEAAESRDHPDEEAHQKTEQALRDSEGRLRAVVDHVVDAIVTIDEDGCVQSYNPAAERIFGYTPDEIVGQSISLLMPTPHTGKHSDYVASYLETGGPKIIGIGREVVGRRKDGTDFPMELAVSEFTLDGRRVFTGIIRDRTERKRLEQQLLQSQKMESIGLLAGGVAHDFNNQLGIILFDVDVLLNAQTDGNPLRDDLLRIRKAVLRSANLTRQLLLFSRRQPMSMGPINLNHHVSELQKMLDRIIGENISVDLDLGADLWLVNADAGNIDQVITNLALNARDAMPRGGGILGIRTENLVVDAKYCQQNPQAREGPCVRLTVSDTGRGMDEEARARLFEPFFTTKEADRGTGLGLAVVYGIVQSHEGWITVQSERDWGSRFEIYLPALAREAGTVSPGRERDTTESEGGGRERILLIEDEKELRERMAGALGLNSYSVRACGSAAEARQVFHEENGGFDLVLSDVVLPDGRGPELASRFLKEQPGLAVLMVTGHTGEQADWDHIREGDLSVLPKPFSVAQLLREVRQVLHRNPGGKS